MISFTLDPIYLEVGAPALAVGLLVGLLVMWLIGRRRESRLRDDLERAETNLKSQEAIQGGTRGRIRTGKCEID